MLITERTPTSQALKETRVIAILRAVDAARAGDVVGVLVENGIRCLELTLTTRGALDVVQTLARNLPNGIDLGVGTVLTVEDVQRCADAGARFVVSPTVVPEVVAAASARGLAAYPGALSPTEIQLAWEAGASAVKLFPGGALGPGYLKAIRAPLPDIPIIPTGGIDIASVRAWLDAGAYAVGLGSPLIGRALDGDGDLSALAERARAVLTEAAA
ncbi:bifunctional 4-hydroxy-2-oxoglutarate aldolase/2-dehydro-3-deoxy-phosphogluconate aldolase [Georgenia sp. AZ-5]|uniref:bifunctional 4-hydroxy-2-oxoglutarate aldolase/2-dehydro-3-deoxy-phosphogluconate aldolase n=1 Tax=Georgenia sp. AZ-5 TaxID=3367526 RepID=UPI003754EF9F